MIIAVAGGLAIALFVVVAAIFHTKEKKDLYILYGVGAIILVLATGVLR